MGKQITNRIGLWGMQGWNDRVSAVLPARYLVCNASNDSGVFETINVLKIRQSPARSFLSRYLWELKELPGSRWLTRLGHCHPVRVSRMMKTRLLRPLSLG
jgi:hypothetical protein